MTTPRIALITGAGQGLGRALATALADRGWRLVLTARTSDDLDEVVARLRSRTEVLAVPGDVADAGHRHVLVDTVAATSPQGLDLLANNASTLGPTPLRPLADLDVGELQRILEVNVLAPHALTRALLPLLEQAQGTVVDISSDAAVEHYQTWGGYGASKAALDHLALTLGSELGGIRAYAVDPGDMRTAMHQAAFPGEDISDRPLPEDVAVPGLLALLDSRPASGRYRAADVASTGAPAAEAAS